MQIWPAIDLRGGKCVRLQQGDYNRETVFAEDPVAMARHWVDAGARYLHLVDLDGARGGAAVHGAAIHGAAVNRSAVSAILRQVNVPCELGGGIRDEASIRFWLDLGIQRLVVGTRALKDRAWFEEMCDRFPGQLALGLDARDGYVATDGWLETSRVLATDLARQYAGANIAAIVYTDISKDGMMSGPNFEGVSAMDESVEVPVIASGGVTTAADVRKLAELGIEGCIIGRTLYEGKLTIADALRAAESKHSDRAFD